MKRIEQREYGAYALANKSLEQVDKLTNLVMFLESKIEKLEAKAAAAAEAAYQRLPVRRTETSTTKDKAGTRHKEERYTRESEKRDKKAEKKEKKIASPPVGGGDSGGNLTESIGGELRRQEESKELPRSLSTSKKEGGSMEWTIAQSHPFGKIDRELLKSSEKSVRSRTTLEKKDPRSGFVKENDKRARSEGDDSEGE